MMYYRLFADLVVIIHLAFVIFAVFGGVLIFWWRRILWLHAPAVFWSGWIELSGRICPLTPLENWLRIKGGQGSYPGDFVGRYVLSLLYPSDLTREHQLILGMLVIFINVALYGYVFMVRRRQRKKSQ